jgi:hypothetical protein
MSYRCCDDHRAEAVRRHRVQHQTEYLNGIDHLEVVDTDALMPEDRQRLLRLHLINPLRKPIKPEEVRIEGGERIQGITAVSVTALEPDVVEIRLSEWGDFSRYTLRLVDAPSSKQPPGPLTGFDARLAACDFTFKVECPSDFDCAAKTVCPDEVWSELEIDYLARDYAGFRRLMLDRITTLIPDWRERHAADLGVALVELLAYAADSLSYQQDAIATEAYLGTARRRVSVRRHTRLVDYRLDEGASARVWVQVRVGPGAGQVTLPASVPLQKRIVMPVTDGPNPVLSPIRFVTRPGSRDVGEGAGVVLPESPEERALLAGDVAVFELAEPEEMTLHAAHNEMLFYTWGATRCCLPAGATSATLKGAYPSLKRGDVLILQERAGPGTGNPADADPAHRHAVRLSADPAVTSDPLLAFLEEQAPGTGGSGGAGGGSGSSAGDLGQLAVTEISWTVADALPFPLCISAQIGDEVIGDLASALGNIVLADQGMTIPNLERLGAVPETALSRVLVGAGNRCEGETEEQAARRFVPPRYRPSLSEGPLAWTNRTGNDRSKAAAKALAAESACTPAVVLVEQGSNDVWTPESDLLSSHDDDLAFTVEVENDGTALLRFGDDRLGKRPNPGEAFHALYRAGGAPANVGAGAIRYIVTDVLGIERVGNPMPAQGGRPPETIEEARQRAPVAFRTNQRAVTLADYGEIAQRHPEVQRAVATFRWTGSWRTVFLTIDRASGLRVDNDFRREIRDYLERFRMAGHDVEVVDPVFVPLELELSVCAQPDHFRSDVTAALLDVFSNRTLPGGRRGVFHPDELTFGQTIFLSRLYAAAQAVSGVASVEITMFQRQGIKSDAAITSGELTFGPLEIPRLDNDPNFPDRGVFRPVVGGGK